MDPNPLQRALTDHFPAADLLFDPADCWPYGGDNSRLHAPPDAVVFPIDSAAIETLIGLCRRFRAPLIARGRGTNTTGAVVPVQGGVILALERMNRILEVDPANRWLIAEPGATNGEVQQAAGQHGFFWPPDPTSSGFCSIGGNLACNAAGPRAVKYGTPRDNTLGLAAVAGHGRRLRTGVYTTKGVVGYDLTRLLIGSEGTLAVITEATLRLTPLPEARRLLQAIYRDIEGAALAVARIMAQSEIPCALEFMDGTALDMIRNYANFPLPASAGGMLMIEVDGSEAQVKSAAAAVSRAAQVEGCISLDVAETDADAEQLWRVRKALSPALRNVAPKKINEDVVVPVSRIPALIGGLRRLGAAHGITIVNFGHAGNGNIHVNLLVDPDDPKQMAAADACLDEVFQLVLSLDGSLSGEHGIGWVKRNFVGRELDPEALRLMREIQRVFDPDGILNPGKGFPDL